MQPSGLTGRLFVLYSKFLYVATPQDNIIETLEAEIVRLKAQLSDTEDRLSKMKEKNDEMAIKLYGGRRT